MVQNPVDNQSQEICVPKCLANQNCFRGKCVAKEVFSNDGGINNFDHNDPISNLICVSSTITQSFPKQEEGCFGQQTCSPLGVCALCLKPCVGEIFVECNYNDIPHYESSEASCSDNLDNDCDGKKDCGDESCATHWRCVAPLCLIPEDKPELYQSVETLCSDNLDNDCDNLIDCFDPDCPKDVEVCSDGNDNDCDGLIDCADSDCASFPACVCPTVDPAFWESPIEISCSDNQDNDCDGLIDCADTDCASLKICCQSDIATIEVSEWYIHQGEGVVSFAGNQYNQRADSAEYQYATIPSEGDGGWSSAGSKPHWSSPSQSSSTIPENDCGKSGEFTYLQMFVTLSNVSLLKKFNVIIGDLVDDGTSITIFNDSHKNGKLIDNSFTYLGYTPNSVDISKQIENGKNRIVVIHVDDCCCGNYLLELRADYEMLDPCQ